jgi:hypothetical protein
MVVGIGGRLLPLHAWYRALQRRGAFPSRSVHRLADPRLTRGVLVLWLIGLPALTAGLAAGLPALVSVGALGLLAATGLNASLIARMNRATKAP